MNGNTYDTRRWGVRMWTLTAWTLMAAAPAIAAPELLHVIPGQVGYVSGTFPIDNELVYTLFFAGPQGPVPIPPWPVRYGELAVNALGEQRTSFVFNAQTSLSFPEFATLATNGSADDILAGGVENAYHGSYGARTEGLYHWSSSALYQLDEVRLEISRLVLSPDRTAYETDCHWEFWGHTVPEPSTWIVLSVLSVAASLKGSRRLM